MSTPILVRRRPAPATPARLRTTFAAAALTVLSTVAACGGGGGDGGGGGGGGGVTPPTGSTAARLNLDASFNLAAGTTGLTVRVDPRYERTSGGDVALAAQTATPNGTAAQQVPVTFDLAPCFADAARRGADQGTGANAVCSVRADVTLLAGTRVIETQSFGPLTLRGGSTTAQAVRFTEVASVRVKLPNGTAAVDGTRTPLLAGQTLALTADALDAAGVAIAGRAVAWSVDNSAVATVDATTGLVTAAAAGQARVTATVGGRTGGADLTVSVPAPPVQRTLSVTLPGAGTGGNGRVTSNPAGVDCQAAGSASCSAPFADGTVVTLTAAPDANSTFAGWGGACTGTAATCAVTMDQARTVSATFARRRVNITIALGGPGTGSVAVTGAGVSNGTCATTGSAVTCTAQADVGTSVTVTATSNAASSVTTWTGGTCTGSAATACTFVASGDVTVGTTFAVRVAGSTEVRLLSTTGATLGGDLTIAGQIGGRPFNGNLVLQLKTSDASPFQFDADRGTQVTLRFQPTGGATVVSWGGVCANTPVTAPVAECTFTAQATNAVSISLR